MKIELKKHEKDFIHISKYGLLRFCIFLGSILLLIVNTIGLINMWKSLGLSNSSDYTLRSLSIVYLLIGEYIYVSLVVMCLVALIKGGFNKLKSYNDEGLTFGLITGLIVGLSAGLIGGLSAGSRGLSAGFEGLIFGLIVGLIAGLTFGLIAGSNGEFD
jgi:hypothetical protein